MFLGRFQYPVYHSRGIFSLIHIHFVEVWGAEELEVSRVAILPGIYYRGKENMGVIVVVTES